MAKEKKHRGARGLLSWELKLGVEDHGKRDGKRKAESGKGQASRVAATGPIDPLARDTEVFSLFATASLSRCLKMFNCAALTGYKIDITILVRVLSYSKSHNNYSNSHLLDWR